MIVPQLVNARLNMGSKPGLSHTPGHSLQTAPNQKLRMGDVLDEEYEMCTLRKTSQ